MDRDKHFFVLLILLEFLDAQPINQKREILYIKDGGYNKLLDKLVKSIGKTKIKLNSKVKQVDFLSDKQVYKVTLSNILL